MVPQRVFSECAKRLLLDSADSASSDDCDVIGRLRTGVLRQITDHGLLSKPNRFEELSVFAEIGGSALVHVLLT